MSLPDIFISMFILRLTFSRTSRKNITVFFFNETSIMNEFPILNEQQKQQETRGEISENSETSVKYKAKKAKLAIYF
jgi:hypothetical protein